MQYAFNKRKYLNISINYFSISSFLLMILILVFSGNNTIQGITFPILLCSIFVYFLYRMNLDFKVKIFSFIIFSLKLLFWAVYSSGNDIIIFLDSHNYLLHLERIMTSGNFGFSNIQYIAGTLHVGHYYFLLIPYLLVGTPVSILFFNTFIISISIILFYKIFENEFGKKIGFFILIFATLSLNLTVFGSLILKDSTVVFLGALSIYLLRVKQMPYMAILVTLALFTVRIYAGFSFLVAILFELIFIKNTKTRKLYKLLSIVGIGVFIIAILAIPSVYVYFEKSLNFAKEMLGIEIVVTTAIALVKFFFTPLPWNVITNYDVYSILMFDSLVMFMLSFAIFLFFIKFIKHKKLRAKMWLFIIPIIVHAVVLGYQYGGDSTRQRSGIFIFLILIIAIGLIYKPKEKANDK